MRVIHFSTGHLGGAGLAARRLNQGLNQHGINSSFHALVHTSFSPSSREFDLPRSFVTRFMSKLVTYFNFKLGKQVFFSLFNHAALSVDYFMRYKNDTTILHFHNFFNLTSQQTILKLSKIGFNVVVTLHDQRFFTGGCHYSFDCKGFESFCKNCPQAPKALRPIVSRNLRRSKKFASPDMKLFLIAPSKWIHEQVIRSQIVPPEQIRFVPNTLGPDFSTGLESRKKPSKSGSYILGIASMDTNSFIKGGDFINKLRIESIQSQLPLKYESMNEFVGEHSASDFWSSIDCLLVLSRADNSPNVIHEAKNFGIPVIGNAVGGIVELLDPNFDFVVHLTELRVEQIYSYLESLNLSPDYAERQSKMLEKFNNYVSESIEEHLNLYKTILEAPR